MKKGEKIILIIAIVAIIILITYISLFFIYWFNPIENNDEQLDYRQLNNYNPLIGNSFFCAKAGQYLTFYDGNQVLLENLSYGDEWQHGQVFNINRTYGRYIISIGYLNMSFDEWYWNGSLNLMEKKNGFYFYDDKDIHLFLKKVKT